MLKISNPLRSVGTHWQSKAVGVTFAAILLLQDGASPNAADVDCLDTQAALVYWRPIREDATDSAAPADDLALELLSCLESPNAELRDRIGYELFTYWLRNEKLTEDTRRTLLSRLSETLSGQANANSDRSTLARSFSALILSEIMRSDSNQPFMTQEDRQGLLDRAITSIKSETDFRGLDAELGWVHPVAHMSDLLWRFALHAETSAAEAESILGGVRSKVAPTTVFYGFNESDRLARVVTTLITRELVVAENVADWISSFEKPTSMEKWPDAFSSPQGMAELHNTKLFLRALSDQLHGADIDPMIFESLDALVQGFTQLI